MKTVIIVGNKAKEAVHAAVERLEPWLARSARVRVDLDLDSDLAAEGVDFAVVLGGDGSVLKASRKLAPQGIPLVGINVGSFGFLTEGAVDQAEAILGDVLEGRYKLTTRMMLKCVLERDGREVLNTLGLNDAVLARTALSRIITIDFEVNGELVTTYRADGLIVATPVGSTAHSLASGGPIVFHNLAAFIVTPICPYTLSNRPLVLPSDWTISLAARDWAERPGVTVDGQVKEELVEGDVIRVQKAPVPLKLIQTGRNAFFETLRNKLAWRGEPPYAR
jgi:NAD+ kinase